MRSLRLSSWLPPTTEESTLQRRLEHLSTSQKFELLEEEEDMSSNSFVSSISQVVVSSKTTAKDPDGPDAFRSVQFGTSEQTQIFPSNAVKTAIYTPYNFLPKNLFKQFTRFSNMYFLVITVLQLLPEVTSSNGVPTMVVPLMFIIVVSGVRDIMEDVQRHQADAEKNSAQIRKFTFSHGKAGDFHPVTCEELKVGELVRVGENDEVPADIALVASGSPNGQCYVMTANLDGESSLKPRFVQPELCRSPYRECFSSDGQQLISQAATLLSSVFIECEPPNRSIDKFKGSLVLSETRSLSLEISHVLLRGTRLKDTPWVIGVVIYTGDDTRVRQNASETPIKASWLSHFINQITVWIVVVQIIILVVAVVMEAQLVGSSRVQRNPYIPDDIKDSTFVDFVWLFLAYMLLFSNFVPISLQVTIDFTRYFQARAITNDPGMRLPPSSPSFATSNTTVDKKHVVCVQSSELNEELGLVEHIFTDKTGTLTCNRMTFRSCHVDGETFDFDEKDGSLLILEKAVHDTVVGASNEDAYVKPSRRRNSIALSSFPFKSTPMQRFLINLAVNNSIWPSASPTSQASVRSSKPVRKEYAGPSPDERALVNAAAQAGVELCDRNNTRVVVRVYGKEAELEILHSFEFTSDRKKSSILCREPSGRIILMSKGADSVIIEALSESANKPSAVLQAKDQMKVYSANGLRVLCIAEREVSADEYRSWNARYSALKNNTTRGASVEELAKIISELECRLTFVGVSAIEDKIQEGAPEALEKFRAAGIKVWMLTGDRADTATNVAHAVRLVSAEMRLLRLCESSSSWMKGSKQDAVDFLHRELRRAREESELGGGDSNSSSITLKSGAVPPKTRVGLALLIDDMVVEAVTGFGIEKEFLELCMECESVLCARISPKQKELIVGMVRNFCPNKVTLSIGDGANDVPMIQGAHIGVGIAGEEGHQASDASDYSLPAFRFLQRLVLVHGRAMNRRIAVLTLYVFYKNVLLVLPQFVYGAFCLYSGQSTYFDTLLQLFNIGFTALPVLVFSIKDDDISAPTVLFYPRLYQDGYQHEFLNRRRFVYWMFEAVVGSALIILVPAELMPLAPWSGTGRDNDLWALGMAQNLAVVVLASARLLIEATSSSRILLILATASVLFWWVVTFAVSSMIAFGREFYGILYVGATTNALLLTLFCCITGLAPAFMPKVYHNYKRPLSFLLDPPILDPRSNEKLAWDSLIMLIVLYSAVMVPFQMGFPEVQFGVVVRAVAIITDVLFFLDVVHNFLVGFYSDDDENMVRDRRLIAKRYLATWFLPDVLAFLPLDYFLVQSNTDTTSGVGSGGDDSISNAQVLSLRLTRLTRLLRITKLTRLIKLRHFAAKVEDALDLDAVLARLTRLIGQVLLVTHIFACFWHLIGYTTEDEGHTWMKDALVRNDSVGDRYIYSFYWVVATVCGVGYGDIHATNKTERLFAMGVSIVGASGFGLIIGSLTKILEN
ncbi:Phospholipid-transporting ATPase [Phytophthora fragariae]|nr:Phospholipid-transporting ATPase [Phytophthora fragariae]